MKRYYSEKPYPQDKYDHRLGRMINDKKRREEWENGRIDPWYSTECRKGEWMCDFLRGGLVFLLQIAVLSIIGAAIISAIAIAILG